MTSGLQQLAQVEIPRRLSHEVGIPVLLKPNPCATELLRLLFSIRAKVSDNTSDLKAELTQETKPQMWVVTQRDRHQLPFAPRAFGSRSQAPPGLQASALGSSSCGQQGSSPLSIFDAVAELYNQYPAQSIAFSGPAVALQLKFVAINSATSIKKKNNPRTASPSSAPSCHTQLCTHHCYSQTPPAGTAMGLSVLPYGHKFAGDSKQQRINRSYKVLITSLHTCIDFN